MSSRRIIKVLYAPLGSVPVYRRVKPKRIFFGQTPENAHPQWWLRAWDERRKTWTDLRLADVFHFACGGCLPKKK